MAKKKAKPMPIRWQQIIDLMPQYDWQITPTAIALNYSQTYAETLLPSRLKRDIRFDKALQAKKALLSEKHDIKTDELIREWMRLGFSNIEDFVQCVDGEYVFTDFDKIDRGKLAAVESIKVTSNTTHSKDDTKYTTKQTQFKLYSKLSALDSLGKIVGVFEKDNAQKQGKTVVEILALVANARRKVENVYSPEKLEPQAGLS